MKIVLMIKFGLAIKKISNVYGINFLDYLSSRNPLLIEYAENKIFAMRKDNTMMKKYLANKDDLETLRPNLILELFKVFEKRNKYKGQFVKIAKNHGDNGKNLLKKPII